MYIVVLRFRFHLIWTCWTHFLPEACGKYDNLYWNVLVEWTWVVMSAEYDSVFSNTEYGDNNDDF